MIGVNDVMNTYVETLRRPNVPIRDLIPGDKLYEYKTNNLLEVQSVEKLPKGVIWEITYNDGRLAYVSSHDMIYTGKQISKTEVCADKCLIRNPYDNARVTPTVIKQFPVDFAKDIIIESLNPDPYIAGALLIHGNFDFDYINLPMDRESADNHFSHKYILDFSEIPTENGLCFYQYKGLDKSNAITWSSFFKFHRIYPVTRCMEDPIIPAYYRRASMSDRWKFVMGAFDIGYSKKLFPNSVSISAADEYRLILLQRMLCSLGVLSRVSYDGTLNDKLGRCYRLDILSPLDTYPRFFYDIGHIEKTLQNDNRFSFNEKFKLRIESIKRHTEGYMYNVRLSKPNAIYLDSNFLPRVSL